MKESLKKSIEVFMPLNSQLKWIDLIIFNLSNRKIITIQVKGSKAYEPDKREIAKYGEGSTGWFFIKESKIKNCRADYFIFIIYVINVKNGRRGIEPHIITIKPGDLYHICKKHKILHTNYSFYIWINPTKNKAFDYRDKTKKGIIKLEKYLDKTGLNQIARNIK